MGHKNLRAALLTSLNITVVLLCFHFCVHAQSGKNKVTGKIIDQQSRQGLPYATLRYFSGSDSTKFDGTVTNDQGDFLIELPRGDYRFRFEYMGYQSLLKQVVVNGSDVNIGTLLLSPSAKSLEEVVVQGEKSTFELALDKKIFNVGKDLANAGGTAADILNNVPSVSVDVEGNISLRGSNARILIDGKPSGLVSLKGGAGLQSLQGSAIERIEVITNPSARYEAEGMGGIINIVLKKDQRQGFNGSFDVITGNPANFGGAANINFRHKDFNFFTNYTLSYRNIVNYSRQYQEVYSNDTTFTTHQTSDRTYKALHHNLRAGADYFFNEKTVLTASYTWRNKKGKRYSDIYYYDSYFNQPKYSTTYRTQNETEVEPNSEYELTFKKAFARKGHELNVIVQHLDNWENSDQYFGNTTTRNDGKPVKKPYTLQRSVNDEGEKQWLFQMDYVQPFAKEAKFETGIRSSFRDMTNDYYVAEQNEDGSWSNLANYTNDFVYNENIQALYGIVANKHQKITYQIGLRGEWSDVTTLLKQTNERNNRTYVNLFPSAHLSYALSKENAVQLSYSRRIKRPRYDDLSPFMTFSDNRNYWSGNPDLNPEFTDALELGHVKYLDKGTITSSVYYRYTTGKILQIRTVDSTGYAFSRPENLSTENAYGAEFTGTFNATNWLRLDGSMNFFRSEIDGRNLDASYKSDTYSWNARLNSRFKLWGNTDFQIRQNYDAPQKLPQGTRKAIYVLDLALSKEVLRNKATLTLNVTDLFNSRWSKTTITGDNFYTYNRSLGRVRQINLILMYRLKQPKSNKKSSLEDY